jgi:hypothetical protein
MARKKAEEAPAPEISIAQAMQTLSDKLPEAITDAPDDRIRAALLRVESAIQSLPWALWTHDALKR